MEVKAGSRLVSTVCTTEVMVVKGPGTEVDITCGGAPMGAPGSERGGDPDAAFANGTAMGKRYVNADDTIEVLCTKPGDGSLAVDDTALELKEAKALPASD